MRENSETIWRDGGSNLRQPATSIENEESKFSDLVEITT